MQSVSRVHTSTADTNQLVDQVADPAAKVAAVPALEVKVVVAREEYQVHLTEKG